MKILSKYIFKTIISYVLLVVLFLFGLHMFVEFLNEFPDIGIGSYGLDKVFMCVFLMLPYDLYQFFPMACLLGSVIALGLLASHSELIVMRASGMSLFNITSAVFKASLVLLIIMLLIGEVLSPVAQRKSVQIKTAAMSSGKTLLTQDGVWLYSNRNIVNINTVTGSGELYGITHYEFDDNHKLNFVSYAEKGSSKGGDWLFHNVKHTEFHEDKITSFVVPEERLPLNVDPKLIGIGYGDTDQKNLIDLYSYIKFRLRSGLDISSYAFAFWQRIFAPLATLVMILLAIPFVFGSLRGMTMGFRMLVGMLFGFGFYILHQFVGPMSIVYHVPPILAALLPSLIFATIGWLLLLRVR